jgi:hypothetical protein
MGMASRTNGQAPRGGPGSADPRWTSLAVCFFGVAVLWALRSVPGVPVLLRWFNLSCGLMDPCEVHVSHFDSSGLASLRLVTWLGCMAPEVAWVACMAPVVVATPWLT